MASPLRAFLIDWDEPHWVRVAQVLARRGLVEPVYWTAYARMEPAVRAAFPSAVFHDIFDAVRGRPSATAPAADTRPTPVPSGVMAALEPARAVALGMMDRMDPDRTSFSPVERNAFFDALVTEWFGAIMRLQPDLVLFPISPHTIYDYVIYALCQLLGIATLMFDRTALPGRILTVERLEEGSRRLAEAVTRAYAQPALTNPATLSPLAESWWERWRGSYDEGMPANLKAKLLRTGLVGSGANRIHEPGLPAIFVQQLRRLGFAGWTNRGRAPRNYLKVRNRAIQSSNMSLLAWGCSSLKGVLHKRRLKRRYEALQKNPDLSQPFVFVAMHYQPERNTSPIGGPYADQEMMVRALSAAAPEGWRLVVKEHGWQLHPQSKGERSRDAAFYDRLAALPNVDLCPIEIAPFALIDAAHAVATVSGSVGWEGLVRGKPALVFGAAWYADCDGVYRIRVDADCGPALAAVAEGRLPEPARVRTFLQILDATGIHAVIEPGLDVDAGLTEDDNVAHLADAIASHIEGRKRHAA